MCEITNPFFAEMTAGVDHVLDAAGLVPFLANTNEIVERQDRFLLRMREHNVDGLIVCPAAGTTAELIGRMREWGMPCVQALRHVSARGRAIMPGRTTSSAWSR